MQSCSLSCSCSSSRSKGEEITAALIEVGSVFQRPIDGDVEDLRNLVEGQVKLPEAI